MKAKQITTYHVKGEAKTWEKALAPEDESKSVKMIESNVINLYPDFAFQTIEGFGGAMTESSAYLLSRMDEETQNQALQDIFGPDGLHARFVRVPIASCDYSLEEYQAVADPIADPDLATFSIDRDRKYVLPMLKKAIEISAEPISVLMSPWSPPYQWKTAPKIAKNDAAVYGAMGMPVPEEIPQRNHGGSLKPEYYGSWAKYVVKYLQAYLDEGIPVTMLSLQNETVAATTWDSCVWTPEESKTYLKDYLYPEMKKAGLTDKIGIFIWDHNKERAFEWAETIIDAETDHMVAGIAFHWYSGDHFEALRMLRERFPKKKLLLSEACIEFSKYSAEDNLANAQKYAHDIIGNLNEGMSVFLDWNLVLDELGGPNHVKNFCDAPYLFDTARKQLVERELQSYIKHFSHYIETGAVRIGVSRYTDKLEITAFQENSKIVFVLLNRTQEAIPAFIRLNDTCAGLIAASNSIATGVVNI